MTTKSIDALVARTQFGKVIKRANKNNARYLVSRRGKPQVVIIGVDDFMRNIVKTPKLLTEVLVSAEASGLDSMTDVEIDKEILAYRKSAKRGRSRSK
jgi:prevent-host-death family protein